ncbi:MULTISPECIES: hypothetical protein [Priestia]|uniref:hypothetical protein n=1 Tax=Priestia TaxID=2800373 RepID=UPI00278139DB|nr:MULTISPECIES: hypothetical protein [Priestia]MDQ0808074.1 hypothetical protein [Priestia megaterium]MED4268588.1 hypothetical protein [Priestia megaterium]MED4279953.1 hypothetical protein [Priestia megaterium]MED4298747.1 hypothetical protein [Priestia megaterium]
MSSASRFKMQIYSPRWGQNDLYQFIKTKDGWKFENYRCKGEVDKGGNPLFYKALASDSISYPDYLDVYISSAWENVDALNKKQVQIIFDGLSEWVSASENDLN